MKAFRIYLSMLCLMSLFAWMGTGCSDDEENGVQQFTVTFDSQGGTKVESQKVAEGEKVKEPAVPAKEQSAFTGWYKEAACMNRWDFGKNVVTADLTLYAGWRAADYTVTFETNGGTPVEPQGVISGGRVAKPETPLKEGFAFGGWYTDAELTQPFDFQTQVTADLTLYAGWTEVTMETLKQLLDDAYQLKSNDYEQESYAAMAEKREAAQGVVYDETATPDMIVKAYQELMEAINNLVKLPVRPTVGFDFNPKPDENGVILMVSGKWCYLAARGVDANGIPSTQSGVIFEHQLADWHDADKGELEENEVEVRFYLKESIASGTTMEVTVKSAENPAIARKVTLKAIAADEMIQEFISLVEGIPASGQITLDNLDQVSIQLEKARMLYNECMALPGTDTPAFKEVVDRMRQLNMKLEEFDWYSYKFDGDNCLLTRMPNGYGHEVWNFEADGAFPCGTYTVSFWAQSGAETFVQFRYVLQNDNSVAFMSRTADNPQGENPTEWAINQHGTFAFTGSHEAGGELKMHFPSEAPEKVALRAKLLKNIRVKR